MRLVAALLAVGCTLGVVVDPNALPGLARVRVDIVGAVYELDVARGASDAAVFAQALTFCGRHRDAIAAVIGHSDIDWAVTNGCPELVAAAVARELRPNLTLTNRSVAVVEGDAACDVEVVTVATVPTSGLERLLASIATHDHELAPRVTVLGLGLGFVGTVQKLAWVRRWLEAVVPGDRFVLFVDGYDTVLQRPIRRSDAGLAKEGEVVFGADRRCGLGACAGPLVRSGGGYRFLNSGSYFGRAADVFRLLDDALALERPADDASDQATLSAHAIRAVSGARLDVDAALHAPLDGARVPGDFVFEGGLWRPPGGGAPPLVLHGNRDGKAALDAMARSLPRAPPLTDELRARLHALALPV